MVKILPDSVDKYLEKYFFGNWKIQGKIKDKINNAIVIPAIGEYNNIKTLLLSLSKNDKKYFDSTLILFVINNMVSSTDEVKSDNKKTAGLLQKIISKNPGNDFAKIISGSGLNIAFIDAFSKGNELSDKEGGVGLARKIGMDLALTAFDYNSPDKKIIICLDADCEVGKNYLTETVRTFNKKNLHAAAVKFEHKLPEDLHLAYAIICYEIFLRYYVLGLKFANSPYSFHTIGSAMACDYESYIKIGGMNKKKAAEDFYFLEKLSKIVNIDYIESTKVYPSARKSWRVPFGTGQRINRFFAKTHREYFLYDPVSFQILKRWNDIFYSKSSLKPEEYLREAKKINSELYNFLIDRKFAESWKRILDNSANPKQILNQKKIWFDGFQTLKLIHHLRDTALPQVNMFKALDRLFELMNLNFNMERDRAEIPDLKIQEKYLAFLRELS